MRGGAYVVTIRGAAHSSVSDAPLIAPDKYSGIAIDAARAMTITRAYLRAFFDRHLKGADAPLLRRTTPFPEASLQIFTLGKPVRTLPRGSPDFSRRGGQ